ncbi:aminopeptidase Y [Microdochium trichocladiopsis]|uniref:Peptide hydrolase n=1 Tax=Microdochium trichocladiopsis TaxID=1682393 RepID=A0A9P8YC72_9PEZI|nr:aminopeptidase Y [Microdochium trichocladiopsis]KAH7038056.1 aminopeptidase Y [Microdochium trichocladiopsis]
MPTALGLAGLALATVPAIDLAQLQNAVKLEALLAKAQRLQDIAYATEGRNRQYLSPGFANTISWIKDTIEATAPGYYKIEVQPTTFQVPSADNPFTVGGTTYNAQGFETDEGIPVGSWTGVPVVAVANLGCEATDFPDATGAIAVILRGTCNFSVKSSLAAAAGAVAVIIIDYETSTEPISGDLGPPEGLVPTAAILYQDGQAVLSLIESTPDVTADLSITVTETQSEQLIATTKCGDQNNILMLGGHADSVTAGPGINDNGSGSVGILEIALQLSKFEPANAVRFAWWSGEEYGLLGSYYYANNLTPEEAAKIRLYLNFDMIASPNYITGIYDGDGSAFNLTGPAGSAEAEKLFEDYFTSQSLPFQPTEFSGRSDYAGFIDIGIPAGGLFSGAEVLKTEEEAALYGGAAGVAYDENYHEAGDDFDNLNHECFIQMSRAIAHATAKYASSWEGFPDRGYPIRRREASIRKRRAPHQHAGGACGGVRAVV